MVSSAPQQPAFVPLGQDLSWILAPLLELPGVLGGVIYSRDGLVLGAAPGLHRDTADPVAAIASSVLSAAQEMVRQNDDAAVTELVVGAGEGGVYYVTSAGDGAGMVLWAGPGIDMGRLAQEVQVQVSRLTGALNEASKSRTPAQRS
ncbi:roadblock/LC7 domain-containing protein [Streptomyces sp. NPDC055036]